MVKRWPWPATFNRFLAPGGVSARLFEGEIITMSKRSFSLNLAAAVFAGACLSATLVPAAAETRSVSLHTADLDLSAEAGRAVLRQRIHAAVEQVCGPNDGLTLDRKEAFLSCTKEASTSAMSKYEAMVAAAQAGKKVAAVQPAAQ